MNQNDIKQSFEKISLDESSKERILQNLKNKSIGNKTQMNPSVKAPPEKKGIFIKRSRKWVTIGGFACASLVLFIFVIGRNGNRWEPSSSQDFAVIEDADFPATEENDELEMAQAPQMMDSEEADTIDAEASPQMDAAAPQNQEEQNMKEAIGKPSTEKMELDSDNAVGTEEEIKILIFKNKTYQMIENPWKNGIYLAKPEQKDIGKYLGTVSESENGEFDDCKVYAYLDFLEKEIICVLDRQNEYLLFGIQE